MLSTLGGWSGGYSDPDCELSDKQVCEGMGKLVRTTGLFTFERCTANNLLRIRDGVRVGLLLQKKFKQGQGRGGGEARGTAGRQKKVFTCKSGPHGPHTS